MTAVSIAKLSETLGAEISGIAISATLSDADFKTIEDALHQHLVVILRDQKVDPAGFVAFSKRFGRPEPHVIDQFHHPIDPNILILSNRRNDKGEPMGLADGGTYFHTDYSYLAVPARCTMLHAQEIPSGDAGTTFANQRQSYEELPDAMKSKIDGLVCRHHYGNRDDQNEASRTAASALTGEQKAKMDWVHHPLVRRHPHTGAKSIYAVSGSSFSIEGMDQAEGVELLNTLKAHTTQPKYCYTPQYRVGDLVIWDNCQLLHSAPLLDPTKPRTLLRITVKDAGPTV
jgi:taurine dioxygenase